MSDTEYYSGRRREAGQYLFEVDRSINAFDVFLSDEFLYPQIVPTMARATTSRSMGAGANAPTTPKPLRTDRLPKSTLHHRLPAAVSHHYRNRGDVRDGLAVAPLQDRHLD